MTLLTSCATANFSVRCPDLVQYSKEKQAKVADEISSASTTAAWPEFVIDYGKMRDACRELGR